MLTSLRRGLVAGIIAAVTIFGLGIYPAAVSMAQSAVAQQPESATVVSFQPLVNTVLPYAVEGFLAIAVTIGGLVAAWVKKKWNIDAEKTLRDLTERHRASLHSAIYTAVANQVAAGTLGKLEVDVHSPAMANITNYLVRSVPDAIEFFGLKNGANDKVIAEIATAKAVELQAKVGPAVAAMEAFKLRLPPVGGRPEADLS